MGAVGPVDVVVWTCVVLFVVTAIVTILALLGVLKLEQYYTRRLFRALVVEVVAASVSAFAVNLKNNVNQNAQSVSGLTSTFEPTLQNHEDRIRMLERTINK